MSLLFERLVEVEAALSKGFVAEGADVDEDLEAARPAARAASPVKPTGPLLSMPAVRCGAPRLTMVR